MALDGHARTVNESSDAANAVIGSPGWCSGPLGYTHVTSPAYSIFALFTTSCKNCFYNICSYVELAQKYLPTRMGLSCFSKSARSLRRTLQFSAKNINLALPLYPGANTCSINSNSQAPAIVHCILVYAYTICIN